MRGFTERAPGTPEKLMRNLIVLSDGTGNSAGALNKTNVWRLYEALDLSGTDQVATFGDGVGTSKLKPLQLLGLALGVGVKKNTIRLYKFLCRNYDDDTRIWCFGFSRGAFTVRTLAGLIHHEGLISFKNEEELDRGAVAAYRAYRKQAFSTRLPWVVAGRWLRDWIIWLANRVTGVRTYDAIKAETSTRQRHIIPIDFLGVWDTVVAYGLPVDELTQAVDKWVWPMTFRDRSLLVNVKCARHALSIDDERRTFFPLPWDEAAERDLQGRPLGLPADRLLQVWFAGVHANVGGGYPDDSLSYVPLCWMIEQASLKGLKFRKDIVALQAGLATPAGRLYDSRSGFGMFYRYQPRDVTALMGGERPLIHHSVITRMALGAGGYAPISLPYELDVLLPYGPKVAFSAADAAGRLTYAADGTVQPPAAPVNQPERMPAATPAELQQSQQQIFEQIIELDTTNAALNRLPVVELVLDTVWWRRLVYFVSLGLALTIAIYPLIGSRIHFTGQQDSDTWVGTVVQMILSPIQQFLPGYSQPWIGAVENNGSVAVLVLTLFAASLGLSRFLQRRIGDRSRAAWRVQARVDGQTLDRLRLTGQSRAGLYGTIALALLALLAYEGNASCLLVAIFAVMALCSLVFFVHRKYAGELDVDAAHPGPLLALARILRRSPFVLRGYHWCARVVLPALFLFACVYGVVGWTYHMAGALIANAGYFCEDSAGKLQGVDEIDRSFDFDTKSFCQKTGIEVSEGRRYRLTMTIPEDGDWFDKSIWTDVRGFPTDRPIHYVAFPLKRWWTKNWFEPTVRVGRKGNFEYALEPQEPLPDVPLQDCNAYNVVDTGHFEPAPPAVRQAVKQCGGVVLSPDRKLVAEFTPGRSGELFLYVNDAVLLWPGNFDLFYRNNGGTAKVTVSPVLATAIVPR
jgi:uncharacterized protein (DUF2235 family)